MLCDHCGSLCSIVHGGRADVNNHLGSKKHKVAFEAAASSSRVTSFFKDVGSASVATLALAAKEATFAYTATVLLTGKVSEVLIVQPSWSQNCLNLNSH